jgi:putative peptidoglycan lipid II flippase
MQSSRKSAVRSGVVTGLSNLAISGSAAVAAAYLAHEFGRGAETDGFLAAYGIYLVLVLGAQAFRLVAVPDLTRAAAEERLRAEARAYALAFFVVAVPLSVLAALLAHPIGEAITGSLPERSADVAAEAVVWLVPAAFVQLLAAVAASALAARDSYGVAAAAYGLGAAVGVGTFVALAHSHGLIALAWGLAANAAVSFGLPVLALALRGDIVLRGTGGGAVLRRLGRFVQGAALPLALQGLYLVGLRVAADLGEGQVTSLFYAYLLAATLVTATASSLSLISSAPLTRRALDPRGAAEHVVHSSWLSLALIAAAAGVFALVGGRLASFVLGDAYSGDVGRDLGQLVVAFAPWMVVTVAYTVTFPLVFVMERTRYLVGLAVAALVAHVPITIGLREAFGINGIALALAVTTALVLVALTAAVSPRMLALSAAGLGRLAVGVGAVAAASFGVLSLFLGDVSAAAGGLALYAALLAAVRPRGLREAWSYVRALH